jgi:hypothetical protein
VSHRTMPGLGAGRWALSSRRARRAGRRMCDFRRLPRQ